MTTPDDDLRSQLHGAADSIDPGDLSLEEIRATARGRGRVSRAGAVVGILGLVSAGVVAFMVTDGSDDPGTLRSADPSVPESTQVPESTVADTTVTTLAESTTPSMTVEVVQRPGVVGQPVGVGGAPDYGEWSVPWGDGFLVGAQTFPPQPLPEELPDEVVALFPAEVVELFDGELPPTIDEAIEMLSEAGLLDVVEAIITENPEAYEAIYSVPSVDELPTLDVRFTTDGVAWDPVEMTLPPGASNFTSVTLVGDRLVVAYGRVDPMTGMNTGGVVRVATTADLANWDVQDLTVPAPSVALPDAVDWFSDVASFAANESGWVLSVYSSANVDFEALLPADAITDSGPGMARSISTDDSGIMIEGYDRAGAVEPTETQRYTWEELGLAPEVVRYVNGHEGEQTTWTSTWGGTPTASESGGGFGQLASTSDGFLRLNERGASDTSTAVAFSPDGLAWTNVDLAVEEGYVSGWFTLDDGVVVLVSDLDGGVELVRLDATGGAAVVLDLPGLPETVQSGYSASVDGAIVLDASDQPPAPPPLPPLVVEHDGHLLKIDNEIGVIEIVDMATGETIGEASMDEYGRESEGNVALGDDGVTVTDPDTGELVVSFPTEVIEEAFDKLYAEFDDRYEAEFSYEPDAWLLGSQDGVRFLLVDLDDGPEGGYVGAVARNADKVLLQTDEAWAVYDLP